MSFASPFPPVSIPDVSLYDYLFGTLEEAELHRTAFIDAPTGAVVTFGEVRDRVLATAGALGALGIGPGDVVGLISPNCPDYGVAFHGVLRAGASVTTMPVLATPEDIAKQLKASRAVAVLAAPAVVQQAVAGAEAAGLPADRVILLDGGTATGTGGATGGRVSSSTGSGIGSANDGTIDNGTATDHTIGNGTATATNDTAIAAATATTDDTATATTDDTTIATNDTAAATATNDTATASVTATAATTARAHSATISALIEAARTAPPAPAIQLDPATHLAALPYSSGTTGRPKGVRLSHRNLVANIAQIEDLIGVQPEDVIVAVLPFFHIYGMTVLLNLSLRRRATLVTMPRFDLGEFLGAIARHRVSFAFIAPPIAVALAKHPAVEDYDLSSLRVVFSGAAPLDGELGTALSGRLGVRVVQGYGMSELSPVSHLTPERMSGEVSCESVGFAVPNSENKLLDPATGEEIPLPESGVSARGELCVRGPNVMLGYLDDADATDAMLDADGFLHTGDVATVDARGVVTIVDRIKELIKYKGYQVAPAELEALLLTHPDVADAAVIGVHDAEGEEVPKAFVVRRGPEALTEQQVMDFVAGRVAPYKKVRRVEFIDAVPKSASGKILRRELRDRERSR